jgi:hypothetical protein
MTITSTLTSLGRTLAYRARSLTAASDARTVYLSFKNGMIRSADNIFQNKDPVFEVLDWESLGADLKFDVTVPVASFSRSTIAQEKLCLGMFLKLQDPDTLFEFGTYRGATTLLLFKNASERAHLFSFDIPSDIDSSPSVDRSGFIDLQASGLKDDFPREFFPFSDRVRQIYADLTVVDWAHIRALPKPGFVFIDADHSYEGCLRDTRNILEWVGDDAMVVWHDASWKKFNYIEGNYGVHTSIVEATSPDGRNYTFRVKDTTLIVRSKQHAALFRRHLHTT